VPEPRDAVAAHGHLRRYVLANERVVVATRRHWAKLLGPIAITVGAFLLIAFLLQAVPESAAEEAAWVWIVWLLVAAWLVWKVLEWYHVWFVATDKRLLLLYGLVVHKVAMMPLIKVTDMGYTRTPLGQMLGYGRFVMESAGQDQALHQIDFVPNPDDTYRKLCATIFLPIPGSGAVAHRPPALMPARRTGPDGEPLPTTQPIQLTPPAPASGGQPTGSPPDWPPTGAGGTAIPKPYF
jgi:membrane protein YdbS with pleckstrin-like domain